MGVKTLLIDLDSQHNATDVFCAKIEDEYTEYKDLDYYRKKLFEEEQDYEEKNEYLSLYLKNLHTS